MAEKEKEKLSQTPHQLLQAPIRSFQDCRIFRISRTMCQDMAHYKVTPPRRVAHSIVAVEPNRGRQTRGEIIAPTPENEGISFTPAVRARSRCGCALVWRPLSISPNPPKPPGCVAASLILASSWGQTFIFARPHKTRRRIHPRSPPILSSHRYTRVRPPKPPSLFHPLSPPSVPLHHHTLLAFASISLANLSALKPPIRTPEVVYTPATPGFQACHLTSVPYTAHAYTTCTDSHRTRPHPFLLLANLGRVSNDLTDAYHLHVFFSQARLHSTQWALAQFKLFQAPPVSQTTHSHSPLHLSYHIFPPHPFLHITIVLPTSLLILQLYKNPTPLIGFPLVSSLPPSPSPAPPDPILVLFSPVVTMAPSIAKTRAGRTTSSFRSRKNSMSKSNGARGRKTRSIRPGTCANCGCTEKHTNLWRSDRGGAHGKSDGDRPMLCNACGLWLAEKGFHRPKEQWKWRKRAHEDAQEARNAAIEAGADPESVPLDVFLPDTYAPVMPIASVRRTSSASETLPPPRANTPQTDTRPTKMPITPSPRLRHQRRPSAIITKRPAPTVSFPAGPVDVELPAVEEDQHTAAKALMGLCSKAWEKGRSPTLPPTPTSPVHWRLLKGDLPSPSWIGRRTRPPAVVPPPAGFHSSPRTLTYDVDLPFEAGATPSLPVPQQTGYRGLAASYFEGSVIERRNKVSSPPSQPVCDPWAPHYSARRNSTISFSSASSSVLLTPPAETVSFTEPFAPSTLEKLSLGPSFEDSYHPPCHPAYTTSAAQAYSHEYRYQQFVSAYKPQPLRRYQPDYPAQGR